MVTAIQTTVELITVSGMETPAQCDHAVSRLQKLHYLPDTVRSYETPEGRRYRVSASRVRVDGEVHF